MDAIDHTLLSNRLDAIEDKIDWLIGVLTTPPIMVAKSNLPPEELERNVAYLHKHFAETPNKPLVVAGEVEVVRLPMNVPPPRIEEVSDEQSDEL